MRQDALLYENIYKILRNRIESGRLPAGASLPSRANLCKKLKTSESTVRRALDLLEKEGWIETSQRKRPVVARNVIGVHNSKIALQKAEETYAGDLLKSAIFLCYPVCEHGVALCKGAEWEIPESIMGKMDPQKPEEFWHLSHLFWRFFILRNGNEIILRVVDGLGLHDAQLSPGTLELRQNYLIKLKELVQTVKGGRKPGNIYFDDLTELYGLGPASVEGSQGFRAAPQSPLCIGSRGLEHQIRETQERYSSVYMDILGQIAIGRYQPGDRLPTHEELRDIYHVSMDTILKAVRTLKEWGVVSTKRGTGIFVTMDLNALRRIEISPSLVACHVRRFLDSLELLTITVEGAAAHAAASSRPEDSRALCEKLEKKRGVGDSCQQSPVMLLEFIVGHIRYDVLRAVYEMLLKNYKTGRNIPNLIYREATPRTIEIHGECLEAARLLADGDRESFAKKTAKTVKLIHWLVINECKRLDYWRDAMRVYDGDALWK